MPLSKRCRAAQFYILFILIGTVKLGYANEISIEQLLQSAYAVRTSNPNEFTSLVDKLRTLKSEMTSEQQEHYYLLYAFKYVYADDREHGKVAATNLARNAKNLEIKVRARMLLANVFSVEQDWNSSLHHLSNGLALLPQINDEEIIQNILIVAAISYLELEEYGLALRYSEELLSMELPSRTMCIARQVNSEAALHENIIDINDEQLLLAIAVCEKENEHLWAGLLHVLIANKYYELGDARASIQYLLPHISKIKNTKYPRLVTEAYSVLASAYFEINKLEIARNYAFQVLESKGFIEATYGIVNAYKTLALIEKQLGNFESSFSYHELYANTDRKYIDNVKAKAFAVQLAKHVSLEQKNKIELLHKENALLASEAKLVQIEAENSRLMSIMAASIAVLISFFGFRSWQTQRRLKTLSEFDYLTNIYNRRHFMTLAEYALKLGNRSRHVVSCITLDLDNFKLVNDSYGHGVGDWVLKKAAKNIKDCTRENDIFARLGGEEFILLLPSCDLSSAISVAEKCIQALSHIETAETGHDFNVSASFGISTTKESGYDMEILMVHSDEAMYFSKENGKNRFTAYSDLVILQREDES